MEFLASLIIILNLFNANIDTIPLSKEHGLLIVPCSFDVGEFKKSGNCLYDTGANVSVISDKYVKDVIKQHTGKLQVYNIQTASGVRTTYAFTYATLTSGTATHKDGQFILAPMSDGLLGIVGSPLVKNRQVHILKDRIVIW